DPNHCKEEPPRLSEMLSPSQILQKLNETTYKLDLSGVVGLFCGDNAVAALQTIHLYEGRRWAGWYNHPGTTTVSRQFGQMGNSQFWDGLFSGPNESPTKTFGYLGYLMAKECADCPPQKLQLRKMDGEPGRDTGTPSTVTVIKLPRRYTMSRASDSSTIRSKEYRRPVPKHGSRLALLAIAPSLVSVTACIACLLAQDLFCAFLILGGITSGGVSSFALWTATLSFPVPKPSEGSPGDGLMDPKENCSQIILKGDGADVNVVTKGEKPAHPKHHIAAISSLLLIILFSAQLLLMPRNAFFGQVTTASNEKTKVQRELLCQELCPVMEKCTFGTRTQMAVFVCLVLGEGPPHPEKSDPDAVLKRIIPNQTPVWMHRRTKMVAELERYWERESLTSTNTNSCAEEYLPDLHVDLERSQFSAQDQVLLGDLIDDAWIVFKAYPDWRDRSKLWQEGRGDSGEEG
ncbi:hypothetical protein BDN67DRAFT_967061, partial [Paxillus ammoniavirescens]